MAECNNDLKIVVTAIVAVAVFVAAFAVIGENDGNSDESVQYEAKSYTITFNLNGGTGYCPEQVTVQYGRYYIDISEEPVRDGYHFVGWSTTPKHPTEMEMYSCHDCIFVSSDITLYAIWEFVITVTYDLNGGTGYCPEPAEIKWGSRYCIAYDGEPTREGYDFFGWSTSEGRHPYDIYHKGDVITDTYGNVILYAVWMEIIDVKYTEITGYGDGFTYTSFGETYSVVPRDGYMLAVFKFDITNVSYNVFLGNYTYFLLNSSDSQYKCDYNMTRAYNEYLMGNSVRGIVLLPGESMTCYAVFEIPEDVRITSVGSAVSNHVYNFHISEA